MIDVMKKLQEIQNRSPEIGQAIESAAKMSGIAEVSFDAEPAVAEAKKANFPEVKAESSYMIDVLSKLNEIASRSPEIAAAIDNTRRMNAPVAEAVEVKTTGDDAVLATILKLAGMMGAQTEIDMTDSDGMSAGMDSPLAPDAGASIGSGPEFSMGMDAPDMDMGGPDLDIGDDDDEVIAGPTTTLSPEMIDDDLDNPADRPYPNSPHEKVHGVGAAVPSGNDLAKTKGTYPKVAGGDNPVHVAVSFD